MPRWQPMIRHAERIAAEKPGQPVTVIYYEALNLFAVLPDPIVDQAIADGIPIRRIATVTTTNSEEMNHAEKAGVL